MPDDEYQARCSFYQLLERWARGGSILDLGCGTGEGLVVLEARGCAPATGVEWDPRLRSYARRVLRDTSCSLFADVSSALQRGPFATLAACLDGRPHRDRARMESALWLARRSRLCQVVVRRPRLRLESRKLANPRRRMECTRERARQSVAQRLLATELGSSFEHLSHYVQLAPPDYSYDPGSPLPARARAVEYTLVPRDQLRVDLDHESCVADIVVAAAPRYGREARRRRLNVGAGDRPLDSWLNLDRVRGPGIDIVHDVTHGLGCQGLEAIYAEHFFEHLSITAALDFFIDAHAALSPGGLLRLVTPNLDWVWATHYGGIENVSPGSALRANRAFYGWEHRFLWNRPLLEEALRACGFQRLDWPERLKSRWPLLRGLEQHPVDPDLPGCPHVLVVDAVKGTPAATALARLRRRINEEFVEHTSDALTAATACGNDR